MENELNDFTPRMIGHQDVKKYQQVKTLYEELVNLATTFMWDTETIILIPELKLEMLFEILKKNKSDLTGFLKREYVKANKISIPGINMEKLISADLVDLPSDYDLVILQWEKMNKIVDQIAATRFYFPLSSLVDPEKHQFELNEEFEKALLNFTATFTENEKQNEILEIVEKFCEAVNDLIELKIVKGKRAEWENVCNILSMGIAKDEFSERPLSPAKELFKRHYPFERFGNHKQWDPLSQSRIAIIS